MVPAVLIQSMRVATSSADEDGRLVLADGRLVAVLVHLADPVHSGLVGRWFLEAGFGPCISAPPPVFANLGAAQAWVDRRLALVQA